MRGGCAERCAICREAVEGSDAVAQPFNQETYFPPGRALAAPPAAPAGPPQQVTMQGGAALNPLQRAVAAAETDLKEAEQERARALEAVSCCRCKSSVHAKHDALCTTAEAQLRTAKAALEQAEGAQAAAERRQAVDALGAGPDDEEILMELNALATSGRAPSVTLGYASVADAVARDAPGEAPVAHVVLPYVAGWLPRLLKFAGAGAAPRVAVVGAVLDAACIAALRALVHVEDLTFYDVRVPEPALVEFAAALGALPSMRVLHSEYADGLEARPGGATGVALLAQHLASAASLECVTIARAGVGAADQVALLKLVKDSRLKQLAIDGNPGTPALEGPLRAAFARLARSPGLVPCPKIDVPSPAGGAFVSEARRKAEAQRKAAEEARRKEAEARRKVGTRWSWMTIDVHFFCKS